MGQLTDTPVLNALKIIGGNLVIVKNPNLTTISGLNVLETVGGLAHISGNPKLSSCCGLLRILNGTAVSGSGTFTLAGGAAGCRVREEVRADCTRPLTVTPSSFNVPVAAGDVIFDVSANFPWEITKRATDDWITSIASPTGSGNQQITIEYEENTTSASRDAILTLATTDGGPEFIGITLTQAGVPRELSADKVRISVNADAGDATFNASANVPWRIAKRAEDDWITSITPFRGSDNQQITIEYDENTDPAQRIAALTLSATDGSETTSITLTQAGTTSPSAVLGLPALAQRLRFYPNPASHTLYIEGISEETSLIIRTLAGKTLLRTSLRQNEAVDIASLPQGVYLLTLQSSEENAQAQLTRRLVIGL